MDRKQQMRKQISGETPISPPVEGENVKCLTKGDLLQGRNKIFYEYFEDFGGELPLRPLTDGQFEIVQGIRLRGITVASNTDGKVFNFADLAQAEHMAHVQTCIYGIATDQPFSMDEVKALRPPGIIAKIARKIYEVSGADPGQVLELINFRQKPKGTGNVIPATGGDPTGPESGTSDPGTADSSDSGS